MSDAHQTYADIVRDFYLVFQPIVSVDKSLESHVEDYEVLLRGKHTKTFPYNDFQYIIENNEGNSVLLHWFDDQLKKVCGCMPHIRIDINLSPQQLLFQSTLDFLIDLKSLADRINVEITETPSQIAHVSNSTITQRLKSIAKLGFSTTLDDVDTGSNNFQLVTENADYINRIKLSLVPFNGQPVDELQELLKKWQNFAASHCLELIVEGIEDGRTAAVLEDSQFDLQQGFYWAHPKMFDCLYKGR